MRIVSYFFVFLFLFLLDGCARQGARRLAPAPHGAKLALLGYSIQAGAFKNIDNAVRLSADLKGKGLAAFYFIDTKDSLYKVRFGNFRSLEAAQAEARRVQAAGLVAEYYIVRPESYAAYLARQQGIPYLRRQIVATAESFIGIPYKWGGESPQDGFDCSGLTMVSYQLNGLDLPRSSRDQYQAGRPVEWDELQPGDLVFFATNGGSTVSHVGVYAGDGRFIHAPKSGDTITTSSLGNGYFQKCFVGGRSYL